MCIFQRPPPKAPNSPAPAPILEQQAPESSVSKINRKKRKQGLSRYKIATPTPPKTNKLGGIPKKVGV